MVFSKVALVLEIGGVIYKPVPFFFPKELIVNRYHHTTDNRATWRNYGPPSCLVCQPRAGQRPGRLLEGRLSALQRLLGQRQRPMRCFY